MGRKNRHPFQYEQLYHIFDKVVTGTKLFREEEDYWNFMKRYTRYFSPYFITYAYCLIPNHYHFLIKVRDEAQIKGAVKKEDTNAARKYLEGKEDVNFFLQNQFSRCFSGVTMKYNNKYKRQGPLFLQGTKRVLLNAFRTFEQQMHYIHSNPRHHFLVKKIEQWPYSSYPTYISNHNTQLPRAEVFQRFGGKDRFIQFHQQPFKGSIEID